MSKITYLDKVALNENTDIPDNNKVKADDMNEIKNVVNTNDANVGNIADLNTEDISNIVNAINEVNNKFNYSTEEQRIGTLFGKPLYRKYLNFNLSTSTIYNSISHNISDIDDIFKIEGRVYDGTEFYIIPASLPTDNVLKYGVAIQSITKSKINIYTGTENKTRNMNAKVFIYYTKTTD